MLHLRSAPTLIVGLLASSSIAFIPLHESSYQLTQDYSGRAFFDNFDFYHDADPTMGHVKYVNMTTANSTSLAGHLIRVTNNGGPPPIFLGEDATVKAPTGRLSTRVYSKQKFSRALVIADILHMPAPVCGTWPAFWMLGSGDTWPKAGEIDILENVNDVEENRYTLHTTAGITVAPNSTFQDETGSGMRGNLLTGNCDVNAPGQDRNAGCSVADFNGSLSYGTAFNNNSGGVFATLIDDAGVRIWFFNRTSIPADIAAGTPYPPHIGNSTIQLQASTWGVPNARFTGPSSAAISQHFRDMQIIFNIAFCGEWAGNVWSSSPTCSKLAPTCQDYVSNHPEAFEDAYWAIQSLKVYELKNGMNHTGCPSAMLPPAPSFAAPSSAAASPVVPSSVVPSPATPSLAAPSSVTPLPAASASASASPAYDRRTLHADV